MHELTTAISKVRGTRHFYRGKARNDFVGLLVLAIIVFLAALAFGGSIIKLDGTGAAAPARNPSNQKFQLDPGGPASQIAQP